MLMLLYSCSLQDANNRMENSYRSLQEEFQDILKVSMEFIVYLLKHSSDEVNDDIIHLYEQIANFTPFNIPIKEKFRQGALLVLKEAIELSGISDTSNQINFFNDQDVGNTGMDIPSPTDGTVAIAHPVTTGKGMKRIATSSARSSPEVKSADDSTGLGM